MQKALARGEAVLTIRKKIPEQPGLVENQIAPSLSWYASADIRTFVVSIKQSAAPTKEKLERIKEHLTRMLAAMKKRNDRVEFDGVVASALKKMQELKKGHVVSITSLEQAIIDIHALNIMVKRFGEIAKIEDKLRGLLGKTDGKGKP